MNSEIATLAGGCFWCTEAIYRKLKGVITVTPGYVGGNIENPTYQQVCTGNTGHAEAIQVEFDPEQISYKEILDVFWHTHDPTTLNQQGNDIGTQYRSGIFYNNQEQEVVARETKGLLEKTNYFKMPIVTKISPLTKFYVAEDYHKNYFENHPNQPYCNLIIEPKIKKLSSLYPKITHV